MTIWLWLPVLLSIALFVFLAISGWTTPAKVSHSVSTAFYGASTVAALLGFIGALTASDAPQTFLFSLLWLPVHEGFRVSVTTGLFSFLLSLSALILSAFRLRSPLYMSSADAHEEMLQLSLSAFGLMLIVVSPTLGQAFVGALIVVGTAIWAMTNVTLFVGPKRREQFAVLTVGLLVTFLVQTIPTWQAWRKLHTVELSTINVSRTTAHLPSGTWVIWVWCIGILLQVAYHVSLHLFAGSSLRKDLELRLAITLYAAAGFYLSAAWPVIVVSHWMLWPVVAAGAVALASLIWLVWKSANGRTGDASDPTRGGTGDSEKSGRSTEAVSH